MRPFINLQTDKRHKITKATLDHLYDLAQTGAKIGYEGTLQSLKDKHVPEPGSEAATWDLTSNQWYLKKHLDLLEEILFTLGEDQAELMQPFQDQGAPIADKVSTDGEIVWVPRYHLPNHEYRKAFGPSHEQIGLNKYRTLVCKIPNQQES